MTEQSGVSVREARILDCERVALLQDRLGLYVPIEPEAARRNWERFWIRNPALLKDHFEPTIGWVIEVEKEIVGYVGSFPRRYRFGEQTLRVAVASSWAIEKPYRTHVNDLAAAYFAQADYDLFTGTTANRAVGRIFSQFSATPMPQRDYDCVLFWVLDTRRFLQAVLRKKHVRRALVAPGAFALSPLLFGAQAFQKRLGHIRIGLETDTIPLRAVGDEFDELWQRKLSEGRRLYAYRTAADIRWYYERSAERNTATVIGCRRRGRLDGYLVVMREETPASGLVRAKIADLFVASNDAEVIAALLGAAHQTARQQGCHILEWIGFPREIRMQARRFRPFSRMFPTFPYYYKATALELDAALKDDESWYPTLYDGDSSLE